MMHKHCKVTVNDQTFFANVGDLLLDAALMNGVDLPYDCRAGICGACRVRLVDGRVYRRNDDGGDVIHACQSRVLSNTRVVTEKAPDVRSMSARVLRLTRLSADVIEVCLKLPKPLTFLPGQYCGLQFRGFPRRSFSPTFPLEGGPDERVLNFHIRVVPDGKVSSALGVRIKAGHAVRITGPFGSAFLRADHPGPILLVSGGTGFAPIWSIAVAAIFEQPQRELTLIAGARNIQSLYMLGALCRLARFPNVAIFPVVSKPQDFSRTIGIGSPIDYMPRLSSRHVVYTAGAPAMTERVAQIAGMVGARCYTDPFIAGGEERAERPNPVAKVAAWLGKGLPETIRRPRPSANDPSNLAHLETSIGPGAKGP
jgi:NAD(P)H-flavin reductase/ferredoxin